MDELSEAQKKEQAQLDAWRLEGAELARDNETKAGLFALEFLNKLWHNTNADLVWLKDARDGIKTDVAAYLKAERLINDAEKFKDCLRGVFSAINTRKYLQASYDKEISAAFVADEKGK